MGSAAMSALKLLRIGARNHFGFRIGCSLGSLLSQLNFYSLLFSQVVDTDEHRCTFVI